MLSTSAFKFNMRRYTLAEKSTHVPYRDSKLTRVLRDCFGGKGFHSYTSQLNLNLIYH
jgi:hypothetical protein